MKVLMSSVLAFTALALGPLQTAQKPVALFDGRTFAGWEGDTKSTWRIQEGAIVGGSLSTQVPRNEFLTTTRSFGDFVLRVKFKLVGTEGFINGGVQIRSQRVKEPPNEMSGYQADLGDKYWGSLYDESRRNKTLVAPPAEVIKEILKPGDWNDYEIRAEGPRIRLSINGRQTVDYTEPDPKIPRDGLIGLQVHGGGKVETWYKEITIEVVNH
jgi:3-keto-disaccharide hydrolase